MSSTMQAVVLDAPGAAEALKIRTIARPESREGWVLIEVRAFGLNRSELHFRSGLASSGSFPRVPGIEAVGFVVDAPGTELAPGSQVAAIMGGMGRTFDGGYAEYVSVPITQVIPFHSGLDWATLGAIPEMLQTANGSLELGLDAVDGQSVLVRGGTSSVGMAITVLAKARGMTVLTTTRNPARADHLRSVGADHVLIDDGHVADKVRSILPEGVDGAVELVGANVLRDTIRATRPKGVVCFTGMLSDEWTIPDFYPMDWLPNGVRLTAYSGEASDLSPSTLQGFLDAVATGRAEVPIGHVYDLKDIVQAHRDLEESRHPGKLVVTVGSSKI